MRCPRKECGEDDNVVYGTRESFMLPTKIRKRICLSCGYRWITEERDTGMTWGDRNSDAQTIDMFEDDETYIHRRKRAQDERMKRFMRTVVRTRDQVR